MIIKINPLSRNITDDFTINCTVGQQVVISDGKPAKSKRIEIRYVQVESQRPNYDLETLEKFN